MKSAMLAGLAALFYGLALPLHAWDFQHNCGPVPTISFDGQSKSAKSNSAIGSLAVGAADGYNSAVCSAAVLVQSNTGQKIAAEQAAKTLNQASRRSVQYAREGGINNVAHLTGEGVVQADAYAGAAAIGWKGLNAIKAIAESVMKRFTGAAMMFLNTDLVEAEMKFAAHPPKDDAI